MNRKLLSGPELEHMKIEDFRRLEGCFPLLVEAFEDRNRSRVEHGRPQMQVDIEQMFIEAFQLCLDIFRTGSSIEDQWNWEMEKCKRKSQVIRKFAVAFALFETDYFEEPSFSAKKSLALQRMLCEEREWYSLARRVVKQYKGSVPPLKAKEEYGDIDKSIEEEEPEIDKTQPLSVEDELRYINQHEHNIYCCGDLVQAYNNKGEAVPVKITGIRHYGIKVSGDINNVKVNTSDIKDVLERLYQFLSTARKNTTTVPALCMLYGVAIMEVDHALVRLTMDRGFLNNGFILTFGDKGWRVNYNSYAEKIASVRSEWGYKDFEKNDNVCFFNPGFEFDEFEKKHQDLWKALVDRIDKVIETLKDMQRAIERPSRKTLLCMYDMLENNYDTQYYPKDLDEYENFLVGVPRVVICTTLEGRMLDEESAFKKSGFFDHFGMDFLTATHKLYNDVSDEWDKESVARYIFGNRKKLTPEQVASFFRFAKMTKRIREDIEKFKEKRNAKAPVVQKAEVTAPKVPESKVPALTDLNPEMAAILRQCKELDISFNLTLVQGDNVGFKAKETYGDNYSMFPGSKVVTNNQEEGE